MCNAVEKNIEEAEKNIFKQYLENNSEVSFFKSTAIKTLKTAAGLVCSPISIIDTFMGTMADGKKVLDVKNERWQGFVIESRDIIKNIGKDSCELP